MATLSEVAEWVAGIYQIEQTDPVLGGAPNESTGAGLTNIPAQQLAKRTRFLKDLVEAAGVGQELGKLVANFDTITKSGFYYGAAGATGAPDASAIHSVLHIPANTVNSAYQLAMRMGTTNRLSFRRKASGVWAAWVEIANTSAFGTIAAQDADDVTITGGSISGINDLAIADGGTGASTAAAARNNLGLGSAATATVQASATDGTAGRLLAVGAFGIGGTAPNVANIDTLADSGLYTFNSAATGAPNTGTSYDATLIHVQGTSQRTQFATIGDRTFIRIDDMNGLGWEAWVENWSGKTVTPIANGGTGATTASAARTALGLGSVATESTVPVSKGGTGATTVAAAQAALAVPPNTRTITAGLGLSGGGNLTADRTLDLALGELDAVDAGSMSTPRFVVIDGTNSATQGRSTASQMRTAMVVYSKSEVDALVTPAAIRALIAETTLGVVGSYAFLRRSAADTAILKGTSIAGSALRYAGVIDSESDYKAELELADNTAPAGTWLALGSVGSRTTQYSATLFLRIA